MSFPIFHLRTYRLRCPSLSARTTFENTQSQRYFRIRPRNLMLLALALCASGALGIARADSSGYFYDSQKRVVEVRYPDTTRYTREAFDNRFAVSVESLTPTASPSPWAVAYQIDTAHSGSQSDTTTPPLAQRWARDLGGLVSYPLIAEGKVFVTVANQGTYGTKLYALDEATGATSWGPIDLGGTFNCSSIAYDAGRVFALNFDGLLRAFDASSGGSVWAKQLPGQYSFTSPPTALGGIVYAGGAGSGGTVYAVAEQDGTVKWTAGVANGDRSSPAVSTTGVYVSYACNQTYDFSPSTGTLIWHHSGSCSGGGGRTPVLFGGRLYARDFVTGNLVFDAATGAVLAAFSAGPAPALSGSTGFFLAGSTLEARDAASNAVQWSFTGDGTLSSAPIVVNGYVYIGSTSGKLYALNAATGSNVWTNSVGSAVKPPDEQNAFQLPGLAAGDGFVVVPASNLLVAYRSVEFNATAGTPQSAVIKTTFGTLQVKVTESGNPVSGMTVRFTAPASGASGTFTGGISTTTATTDASGVATAPIFSANGIAGGPYTVTASLPGGSPSATFALTNLKAATTTTLSSSASPSASGQSVSFTATLSSAAGTPTGTVQFRDNGTNIGPAQTLNASAQASVSTSSLTAGTHTITADYSGDANFVVSSGSLSGGQTVGAIIKFSSATYQTTESSFTTTITVRREGDKSQAVTVDYATSDGAASLVPCSTANGVASSKCDFTTALGTLNFGAGEDTKAFTVLISQDNYVEGPETLTLTLSNATGASALGTPATATLTINDDLSEPPPNPIDDASNFVRQHYHDFLNREPDQSGLDFWAGNFTQCAGDPQCLEVKRINTSAAFFLSIEFQQTGYLVERIYKAAYKDVMGASTFNGTHQLPVPVIRLNEFLHDTQEIGLGVVVGQGNWQQQIESNKEAFAAEFVQRPRFIAAFPSSLTPEQFVDALNANAGNPLSSSERDQLVADLKSNTKTRAQALRAVAEDQDLNNSEFNRAFVLMQFFGYLRRNPDELPDHDYTGYDFWLTKLNQFNGSFQDADMVKAFISSAEYRQRFGP
jgi:outer membrane protein assembly factor BamB